MTMKILIVDDDENSRVYLERALLKQGYQVEGVQNGAQALARVGKTPYQLIISDILMPELDGFELCRRMKTDERLRGIPFVFYSATYIAQEDRRLAMRLGASRFLIKPMELDTFFRMIDDVIGEVEAMKLPVPDHPLGDHNELDRMQVEALTRKLEEKIEELRTERAARERTERELQSLKGSLRELIHQGVLEERKKDDLLVTQGRQAFMGEMINNIAHQWRQPINTLGLLAQDLQMTWRLGKFSADYMETNVRKTMAVIQAMSKTIDDFRTFFKEDRAKVEFKVLEAIAKIVSFLEEGFRTNGIRITVHASGDPVVHGYLGEFSQVILNILMNARDALLLAKAHRPLVSLRVFQDDGRTVLLITDNAGGIDEEIIGKIFDPYFSTKGPDGGTGIGLFMAKSIIEKHMGGSLTVRNVKKGAEFRIEL
jgi:signal transduction histidine kinase